jgi:23S rRNA (guanosine2251-2'-O)-methyltransferase
MADHWVYGLHAVEALLRGRHRRPKQLFINQDREDKRLQALRDLAAQQGIAVENMSLQKMDQRFSDFPHHQGAIAKTSPLPEYQEADLGNLLSTVEKKALILILDGITDPHNLGACLRVADAVDVDFVIVPKDKSASITPVVTKTASGAAETVPIVRVTNLARAMDMIKAEGIWIFGAAGEASESLYSIDLTGAAALALGAEGTGLRRLTRESCDALFSIPMMGSVESLNVSVATGVSLYEALRQRGMK